MGTTGKPMVAVLEDVNSGKLFCGFSGGTFLDKQSKGELCEFLNVHGALWDLLAGCQELVMNLESLASERGTEVKSSSLSHIATDVEYLVDRLGWLAPNSDQWTELGRRMQANSDFRSVLVNLNEVRSQIEITAAQLLQPTT